jgi:sensor histidine kinase regulating citrate/malate metabolism
VYAFDNMLRAIVRDLIEGQTLSIRPLGSAGVVLFEFASPHHPISEKLAELLDGRGGSEPSVLPLGLVFAKALIERNGGRVDIRTTTENTTISVRLPSREETVPGDGKAASLDS